MLVQRRVDDDIDGLVIGGPPKVVLLGTHQYVWGRQRTHHPPSSPQGDEGRRISDSGEVNLRRLAHWGTKRILGEEKKVA